MSHAITQPRLVLFVAFDGMGLLDLTGPQTVFWAASKYMAARGLPGYERHTVSEHGGLAASVEGVALATLPFAQFTGRAIDTIIVPGAPEVEQALCAAPGTVAWLRTAAQGARRTASVCSGAFLLAQAGLLEGKRVATHWAMCDRLQALHPALEIDRDAIFLRQDAIWTSAGVTAGIDLALALVEADCGREVAMLVARELVVFLKRPGGQAQFSVALRSQSGDGAQFDELHRWLADNLASTGLNVELLAEKAGMSPRNFSRVYKQKTGRSPGKAVELFRLEAARRMLEQSRRNIDQIARDCGFGDEEHLRMTFQRNLAISPLDYRKRFSAAL